jgi:uncharacterized membrane protein (UPF0127 family)
MRTSELFVDGRRVALSDVADTWASRFRGLLGRRDLPEALVLSPESSVHGIGMRVPLDVALLDGDGIVLRALVLRPWGVTRPRRGTVSILEAPVGSFGRWGLHLGSTVTLGRAETAADG